MAEKGMTRWANRVALVTGASAGIGAEICRNLVKHGLVVIGCARNKDAVQNISDECEKLNYPGKLVSVKCDVTKENEINEMFKFIETNYKGVDVCVNNAGFTTNDTLLELTADKMRDMLNVNVVALTLISSKAANSMLARGVNDGHIFNINSMSGHRIGTLNFYSATKFAVTALTEGFRRELVSKSRIRVTSICPGLVETEFATRAFGEEKGKAMYARREDANTLLQAQDIADALVYALSAPENAQVHDILIRPTGDTM